MDFSLVNTLWSAVLILPPKILKTRDPDHGEDTIIPFPSLFVPADGFLEIPREQGGEVLVSLFSLDRFLMARRKGWAKGRKKMLVTWISWPFGERDKCE